MIFKLSEAVDVLSRTPEVLRSLFTGLSDEWLKCNEGDGTWNATEVLDHLIEGEKTNWIPRLTWLLREGESRPFPPFDRYAHLNPLAERAVEQKLQEFASLRAINIAKLKELASSETTLQRTGRHPAFGTVKASELISTWTVHDLAHLAQIARVMAKRYTEDVGPWVEYLGILKK